ncbi:MAG: BolA/IbaG family iron-sulfur metabolism protein [Gammaproteobacteria bacterium]|nr:BolA/IbaG family iron-sulfur metabolism protein [Gammaproteobacteria bacterium]
MQAPQIEQMILSGLPGADVKVKGDDGVHFEAVVVAEIFRDKSILEQHRMVYATLGDNVENAAIHALALKTQVPQTA